MKSSARPSSTSSGGRVVQETLGWDDVKEVTVSQRSKEEAHDYRYFPEPDLPPLEISRAWVEQIKTQTSGTAGSPQPALCDRIRIDQQRSQPAHF